MARARKILNHEERASTAQTQSLCHGQIIVKKFGGTSVGTVERINALAKRLAQDVQKGERPVVVVSAMAGETNRLVGLMDQVDPENRGTAYDMLVASGEQVSVALLSAALIRVGLKAEPMLGFQLGIRTDSTHSKARIQELDADKLISLARRGVIPVVAGFQGIGADGTITTLGRGGSDTTAVAIAAQFKLLNPPEDSGVCEIYTDVPAVFTADPRLIPRARELQRVGAEEMMEMASLGSKVLHIRCVELAAKFGVRIHLRSSFESREGTWIEPTQTDNQPISETHSKRTPMNAQSVKIDLEEPVVAAVTHDANTAVFQLEPIPREPKFLADLFKSLAAKGVVVDIITQSESRNGHRLAFSVTREDIPLAQNTLREQLSAETQWTLFENMAKLSIVGQGMRHHPGVAARFFEALADCKVQMHLITTSEIKVSAVISLEHLERAAAKVHAEFGLDRLEL